MANGLPQGLPPISPQYRGENAKPLPPTPTQKGASDQRISTAVRVSRSGSTTQFVLMPPLEEKTKMKEVIGKAVLLAKTKGAEIAGGAKGAGKAVTDGARGVIKSTPVQSLIKGISDFKKTKKDSVSEKDVQKADSASQKKSPQRRQIEKRNQAISKLISSGKHPIKSLVVGQEFLRSKGNALYLNSLRERGSMGGMRITSDIIVGEMLKEKTKGEYNRKAGIVYQNREGDYIFAMRIGNDSTEYANLSKMSDPEYKMALQAIDMAVQSSKEKRSSGS